MESKDSSPQDTSSHSGSGSEIQNKRKKTVTDSNVITSNSDYNTKDPYRNWHNQIVNTASKYWLMYYAEESIGIILSYWNNKPLNEEP